MRLVLGDCLDPLAGMATLPDKSVGVTLCDPPYSRNLYARTRTNKGSGIRANGRPYRTTRSSQSPDFPSAIALGNMAIGAINDILEPVAEQMLRTSRRWIIVFSDIEIAPRWRAAFGDRYIRTGIWLKPDAMPQVTGDRPGQGFEAATIAHVANKKRWNGGGRPAVWIFGTAKGLERPEHPCPKPLDLMEALVRDFTDPGELVCDPFAGSGTTAVACKRLGRRFIGWERDPVFHAAAVKRIEAAREQFQLLRQPKPKQARLLP